MADYGLLSGLADGLKQGLLTYQATRNAQNQEQMTAAMHGLIKDPETGAWGPNQAKQDQMQLEQAQTSRALHGLSSSTDESANARAIARGAFRQSNPNATEEQIAAAIPDTMTRQDVVDYGSNFVKPTISGGYVMQGNQLKTDAQKAIEDTKAKTAKEVEATKAKTANDITDKKIKSAAEIAAGKNKTALDITDKKTAAATAKADEKRWGLLANDLDPNKARGGNLAKLQATVNAGQRLKRLFEQFPDGNIPESQTIELATGAAALINGGSAQSQQQINHIVPQSALGNIENLVAWYKGEPRGKQQQAFVKLLQESVDREMSLAAEQVHGAQAQRLTQYEDLAQKDPEHFNRIVGGYGFLPNEFNNGHYTGKTQGQMQMAPAAPVPAAQQFGQDVLSYAQKHGISPQEAQNVKNARGGK